MSDGGLITRSAIPSPERFSHILSHPVRIRMCGCWRESRGISHSKQWDNWKPVPSIRSPRRSRELNNNYFITRLWKRWTKNWKEIFGHRKVEFENIKKWNT
ncbi:hypothetical protein BLNAU_17851 [Blattamonas nauphoetae]|uniref:Uncharacterized protein n=1 Tax=Blattamonas nauphoetae TaxID=2049346 RepID=A0ABQ9X948_9EUKA|nr:hypothetical protein BLNAU_17851 [Blattamonas nauphoetae]